MHTAKTMLTKEKTLLNAWFFCAKGEAIQHLTIKFMEMVDNCVYSEYTVYKDIYSMLSEGSKGANAVGLWKGAWYLAKHELIKDGWRSLYTLLFVGYLLLFTVPLLNDVIDGKDGGMSSWATDFIYLTILPILGFVMNQTMMRYWKENSYTKKMAQWRTLPISSRQIALGRIIQLAVVLFFAQLLYFILQFIFVRYMGADISAGHFALYALFWFGYSLTVSIGYVYWEVGHSGKMYFFSNMAYIAGLLLISIGLAFFKIGNIVVTSFEAIGNGFWWISLAAIAVSAVAIFIGVNRIEKRLESRTYRT